MATTFTPTNAEQAVTKSTWALDTAHTSVQFSAKHMMISTVRGHFGEVTGELNSTRRISPSQLLTSRLTLPASQLATRSATPTFAQATSSM